MAARGEEAPVAVHDPVTMAAPGPTGDDGDELGSGLERFTALVERMPIGVVVWDATGVQDGRDLVLLAANSAAHEMTGFDVSGNVGRRLRDVFPATADHDDVARALSVAGTDRAELLGEGDFDGQHGGRRILRRRVIGLPGPAVAFLMEDVTEERVHAARRRLLLQRLVDSGDRDRRHLAMALHDEPIQHLAAAAVLVQSLRRRPDVPDLADRLREVEASLHRATTSLRDAVFELAPAELEESGLLPAIRRAAEHLLAAHGVAVDLDVRCDDDLPDAVQEVVHRVVVEAMTNVRKHAAARAVEVRVVQVGGRVEVSVADDGRGIAPDAGGRPAHFGLRMIADRVEGIGGRVRVVGGHDPEGRPRGTVLTATVPSEPPADAAVVGLVDLVDPVTDDPPDLRTLRVERDGLLVALVDANERFQRAEERLGTCMTFTDTLLAAAGAGREVAATAAEGIATGIGDGCAVLVLDGSILRCEAVHHELPEQQAWLRDTVCIDRDAEAGPPGEVLRTGRPLLLGRGQKAWPLDALELEPAPHEVHGAVLVPLRGDDGVGGVVVVFRDVTSEPLTASDLDLTQGLADRLALIRDHLGSAAG